MQAVSLPTGSRDLFLISDRLFRCSSRLNSLLYICTPNSGNAPAKYDLAKELAANADAAYNGYFYCISTIIHASRCRSTHAFNEEGKDTAVDPDDAVSQESGQRAVH